MTPRILLLISLCLFALAAPAQVRTNPAGAPPNGPAADVQGEAIPSELLAKMPVKEVTIFKDGHAFMLHEGVLPTDIGGNITLDTLPRPVIGTFWPYSAEKSAKLTAVLAGARKVRAERPVQNMRELIDANPNAEAVINENGVTYSAVILGTLAKKEAREAVKLVTAKDLLQPKESLVALKTADGVKVVELGRIQGIEFKMPAGTEPKATYGVEEPRSVLTLALEWKDRKPEKAAVGMVYLQRGIRWIPNYHVNIDGKGNAVVKLQATLLNELTDLQDVTANLVVGVPSFAFKDTVDPMAAQQAAVQLSTYFQEDGRTGYAFSNAIMTQTARMTERPAVNAPPPMDLGPELGGTEKNEDLFVFTLKHLNLKRGERMIVPVAEFTIPYQDVYLLNLPYAPPREVFKSLNTQQQAELARLFNAPKVMHKVRLTNRSAYPLTTAPALIFRQGRLLAQGMMTYTAIGAQTDLGMTTAVDVQVKKLGKETKRTPNAVNWDNNQYMRVDLAGTVTVTNHLGEPIELEVTRQVLGDIDEADHDGKIVRVGALDEDQYLIMPESPHWWGWYSWPYWWSRLNGNAQATWKLKLEPGKSADLGYAWHYFWR
ncbi:MAG: hypothetical protein ACYC6A_13680 [Armatimonadota bacterium]